MSRTQCYEWVNPPNAELNPICHLLALLRAHHILHVGGLRVKHFKEARISVGEDPRPG